MVENTFNTQNLLGYEEIALIKESPKARHKVLKTEFRKLTNRIVEEHIKEDTVDVDVAYRFQFKVVEDMNIMGKITSIPVMDVVLKQPRMEEPEFVINQPRKFTIKERLKILFKGAI